MCCRGKSCGIFETKNTSVEKTDAFPRSKNTSVEKIDVFLRGQKTPPWKKVRENLRKNGKRGKNTKIVLKWSTFAKNLKALTVSDFR